MNYLIKDRMKSLSALLLFTFMITVVTGCGSETETIESSQAVDVKVQTASTSMSASTQSFPGMVESDNQANLSTIVMGTVTEVPVEVGEKVKKGDVLIRIKDDQILAQKSQLEANMVQAKANLENTEKNYNRIKNLYAEESATSKELDDISTMYEIAKANMDALNARMNEVNEMLAYTTIRAPFDGIVAKRFVSEGDMAAPGHPLVAVADPGAIKITANVPAQWIGKVSEGSEVKINIESAGIYNASAKLIAVSEAGDPMSRQFALEAKLNDGELASKLKTGMFAQIAMNLGSYEGLYVPKAALQTRGQLTGVYTFTDDEKAVLRWVRLGQSKGDQIEILSGLTSGERYIVEADGKISQGIKLNIQ
ncbi:efflux RND transporter periplasmic adaptor subunit [Gracilimonas sp. Q87]|uniref:efflux RND transporter periplasmic adaptor subunit n=1 Tax=Gracilimonas sp. Q87 TaxID=3384766 RepID=UPI003983F5B1